MGQHNLSMALFDGQVIFQCHLDVFKANKINATLKQKKNPQQQQDKHSFEY